MTDLLIDNIEYASSFERRRQCFADLMDGNRQVFGSPSTNDSWQEVLRCCPDISEADQKVVAKALGMVVAVFRSAQMSINSAFMLEDLFSPEKVPEVAQFQPDPAAMALAHNAADDTSAQAFGRSITVYKNLEECEMVPKGYLLAHMLQTLDALPGSSKIHQSVVETAKQLITLDMEQIM